MNIGLLIAGGTGTRMNQNVPKQFLTVNEKPIVIYTLEAYQNHHDIDAIYVSCLSGWENVLEAYAKQFNITKLMGIVQGGENGQASIRNGLLEIEKKYNDDDIVLIQDGNRPMVSQEIITDCIAVTRREGNAIAAIPCADALLMTENGLISSGKVPDRTLYRRTQTPQGFFLKDICELHRDALKMGIINTVSCCTLMVEMGKYINFSLGSEKNLKITTPDDLDIFRALLNTQK